jgi:DNA-binding LacI/PurR family transcriptional regulator
VISNRKVDGAVILRTITEDPAVSYLKEKGVPFVVLGTVPDEDVIQVDNNHIKACKELTGRLLDEGMRKIALLGGDKRHIVTRNRLAGFLMAYKERQLKVPQDIIYENIVKDEELDKAIDKAIAGHVECIMCMDDTICSFVLQKLERQGIEIPGQVCVAAFYNNSILEKHIPSVTSLKFDARQLGSVCGEILLQHIAGQEVNKITMLEYQIIEGDSTKA